VRDILQAFITDAREAWDWLGIDTADPTLAKFGILLGVVIFLLWVLADVYRGEIQNQDFEIGITNHGNKFGYGEKDAVFTKQTFDIRSESLPAAINIFHTFTIIDGEKRIRRRIKVRRKTATLRTAPSARRVDHELIALSPNVESEIKARAEYLQRQSVKQYDKRLRRQFARLLKSPQPEIEIDVHAYLVRFHFSANPFFLLFMHPDRDVKATGWLTLLTSLFAVLTEFLF
jgi:hypothetical protein